MTEKYTYQKINALACSPKEFISECNKEYHEIISGVSAKIFADRSKKIVLLAGPSSSGKTTTAKILSEKISMLGGKAYTVSLDDFYLPKAVGYPLDENGNPDYECVEALDLELLHSSLSMLSETGKASLPVFDFVTGERTENAKNIELLENDIIIVEGLHALNPVITDTLDEAKLMKIYISVSSRVYDESGEVFLSKRDLRFVRRAVRDSRFRSTPVERTFEIWQSVMRGEDRYLFPFKDRADIKINSFHPCEPCIFAVNAISLLKEITDGEYFEKSEQLINKLGLFKNTDYSLLPEDSLLREFTG
ncbi:MAG: nucleoside kinase [Clostridia bacterium]|nr:nucleoside kinase [Clostridia bacterium]